jgi:hypothetical protein
MYRREMNQRPMFQTARRAISRTAATLAELADLAGRSPTWGSRPTMLPARLRALSTLLRDRQTPMVSISDQNSSGARYRTAVVLNCSLCAGTPKAGISESHCYVR